MNKLATDRRTPWVVASPAIAFGTAYAEREPVMPAPALMEQGACGSYGESGSSGTLVGSGQPGQADGASTSGAAASGRSFLQDLEPAAAGSGAASDNAKKQS